MRYDLKLSSYGIPKTVKVGAFSYKILFPYSFDEDSNFLGLHQCDDLIIKLGIGSPSHQSCILPPQKVHEAFLHEVFHAIDYFYSGNMMEEKEIDLLAITWHSILQMNNLSIHKNVERMPKKIKVINISYDVELHKFADVEARSQSSNNTCKMQLPVQGRADDVQHPLVKKCNLVTLINFVIVNTFDLRFLKEDQGVEDLFCSFSNGIFQVLRDNNIEGMINRG